MIRRLFVHILRRSFALSLVLCLACSAQSVSTDLTKRIERHVRAKYNVPAQVQITLGDRHSSTEFPGYDAMAISFSNGDRKDVIDFLISKDDKTLIRLTKVALDTDPYADIMSKIDVKGRPVRGNKDAKVTIINFDDFQCPFCARMHQTLFPDVARIYGDKVKFIYKDFPLVEIHPWAKHAAIDGNCLASQNSAPSNDAYWEFADQVHNDQHTFVAPVENQNNQIDRIALDHAQKHNLDMPKLQACLKAQDPASVDASMKEGSALGIEATHTLFINGEKIDGAVPLADLRAMIDRALKDAGVEPPPAVAPAAPATK